MLMIKERNLKLFAWTLSGIVVVLALLVWAQGVRWNLFVFNTFRFFPLLGLLAFSLMWAHYIVAAVRMKLGLEASVTKHYFEVTSLFVLVLILLHPGLLIWRLWRMGYGPPPNSYLEFVTPPLQWAVMLGSISLVIFLLFELRRKFRSRSWWKFVAYANDAAIIAVYIHASKLGGHVQNGWYRYVWLFYGLTLVGSLIYMYGKRIKRARTIS